MQAVCNNGVPDRVRRKLPEEYHDELRFSDVHEVIISTHLFAMCGAVYGVDPCIGVHSRNVSKVLLQPSRQQKIWNAYRIRSYLPCQLVDHVTYDMELVAVHLISGFKPMAVVTVI
jgi:hypothetical protein